MGNSRDQRVLNVYGEDNLDIVDSAVEVAMEEEDAESVSEAVTEIASAYIGL